MANTQARVSLHPVASRHGQQSSTIVSVKLPCSDPDSSSEEDTTGCDGAALAGGGRASPTQTEPLAPLEPEAKEWGIRHDNISAYPIIDGSAQPRNPHASFGDNESLPTETTFSCEASPPIRAMTATQFAALHEKYVSLDVPHRVVFPFLHGVDGDNKAQNLFFGAPPSGQPTPHYRGLTVVRADMPTPEVLMAMQTARRQRATSYSSTVNWHHEVVGASYGLGSNTRPRTFSVATTNTVSSSTHSSASADSEEEAGRDSFSPAFTSPSVNIPSSAGSIAAGQKRPHALTSSHSSASVTSSTVSSQQSGPSLFSDASSNVTGASSSQTSVGSNLEVDEDLKPTPRVDYGLHGTHATFDPQPRHSILNSTIYPNEVLIGPDTLMKCGDDDSGHGSGSAYRTRATFASPRQAAGVSLRNFKIQCAKYATISDVVIYCPAGFHDGVLTLAHCFRDAQDTLWEERHNRGLGGLRYNVFIVTDPFDEFERNYPHLVSVDGSGYARNQIDFVEREREEMQRLTAASEIDENVWLGCTADAPMVAGTESSDEEPLTPDGSNNPHGFAICIEAHESAAMPTPARLAHASHYLEAVEATALFEFDSKDALRRLDEDDDANMEISMDCLAAYQSSSSDEEKKNGSLVLGPNGWCPSLYGRPKRSSLKSQSYAHPSRRKESTPQPPLRASQTFVPEASSIVNLECSSTSQYSYGREIEAMVEDVFNLCAWIKKQASPSKAAADHASPQSFLSGALRGFGASKGVSAFSPLVMPTAAQHGQLGIVSPDSRQSNQGSHHLPRRILLHCGDGYTETSILALAYIMYSRDLSLPEAYLDLQLRANRSFFVYARDLSFLKRVEQRILADRKSREKFLARDKEHLYDRVSEQRPSKGRNSRILFADKEERPGLRLGLGQRPSNGFRRDPSSPTGDSHHHHSLSEPNAWIRGFAAATGFVSTSNAQSGIRKPTSGSPPLPCSPAPPSRARTPTPKGARGITRSPPREAPPMQDHGWFHDSRFEGSFPSRILPFLYLGNLNHALNAKMLHALGITHVVSVGETAIDPPPGASVDHGLRAAHELDKETSAENTPSSINSLYHEFKAGRISVLDMKNVSDDGIDPLRATMREAVEYIERARRSGGRVLVHCRVGVSRSSTIVLAYVMAHLDLNLVESYLLVRSRRLNILIQPHLLFFWELRGWETYLAAQKAKRASRIQRDTGYSSSQRADEVAGFRKKNPVSLASLSLKASGGSPREDIGQNAIAFVPDVVDCDDEDDLDLDLAVGAGSAYGFNVPDALSLPFGCGSLAGLPASSMRLMWGHLAREISDLNSRYFV
ncbi:hypothetical protein IE53DRAFT_185287 [Violaceomyces palustris]|uniref:Uncharacterized protein n=1 Tax=Violaceomyces palustris TaxID=1673888 RepID=A0ACD0NS31_9BASI|nr:hypothetical protein IE53DRAFT_185287 [Violaceomyces palustris]